MAGRRIAYCLGLLGCAGFYWAYREWFSWVLLVGVAALPWLSLLLSLPAMLTTRLRLRCPSRVMLGESATAEASAPCPVPQPGFRAGLSAENTLTGEKIRQKLGVPLPTGHCGKVMLALKRPRVFDYLGLFKLPLRRPEGCGLLVTPRPISIDPAPDTSRYRDTSLRPKAGGFAENHDLRPYRPGDSLHQIHWKLSAKTDTLIFREPLEPVRGLAAVTLELRGTPEELDEKLGKLFWLGSYLLEQQIPHEIYCRTGRGLEAFQVDNDAALETALDAILSAPPARDAGEALCPGAAWQYHIGGGEHEAE